ncbi:penicillin-binding transpeptidase domain-containing protein [Clostridium sp. CF012]|uniref:penicillin-binding transpeptidase domain-containing protein n=1 Tax=Clostridium sp. CF012 TaxID=2843319 RepID=UPI001C0AF5F4|nr:penicillin-binding transpeptidase domain-containing protein [Clostridium sp. CF012]MBU3141965.1 penicillin-binding protein 2 [Clostridium sp. CF012]
MYRGYSIFGDSNQRREIQKRTWMLMSIFILLFCFLIWKITNYMYFKAEPLKAMADAQYTIDEKYGLQYNLLDCKNNPLLDYEVKYYAIIDPLDYLRFNDYTSKYDLEALTITLRNYNSNYDLEKINGSGNGQKLKYEINEDTFDKLKDIKGVKGFYTYAGNEVKKGRYWKIENLLINTTYNKTQIDPVTKKEVSKLTVKSDDSLEMQIYNKTKNNKFTKIGYTKGVDGEISEGKIVEPENNVNVRLTLDKEIQVSVEEILHADKYKNYGQIGVVLMESSTGKIRAMAQKDDSDYNPNLGMNGTNGALPGSIFKVIVEEAGLDLNLIDVNKVYTVDPNIFKEEPPKGDSFTVAEALAKSSNNIFGQFGKFVTLQNMYNYAQKQGMLAKVLNFQQEEIGDFGVNISKPAFGDTSLAAIGQKTRITPLQAISIPNTIINNGIYVQPSIIDAYVDDNNEVLEKFTSKSSRVLKSETAETVKSHMMDVVTKDYGTGDAAYIKGMSIGGKTGTTTYKDNETTKSDGWFVGFFTFNEKKYSMVVFVNNIKMNVKGVADEEGGGTAAPIFKEVVNALKAID